MVEISEIFARYDTNSQLRRDMMVSFHVLENAVVHVETNQTRNYSIPIQRFSQLAENVKSLHDFSRQRHKPWVFPIWQAGTGGEGGQYVMDLRTQAISVAERTRRGFRNIRRADITEISDHLLPCAVNLIEGVCRKSPYEIEEILG